jgi:integrase
MENEVFVAQIPQPTDANDKPGRRAPRRRPRGTGSIHKVGRMWYIAYYLNGTQVTESSRSDKKSVAEEMLRSRLEAVRQGSFSPRADRVTFGELAEDLVRDYETTRKRTLRDALIRISLHLAPFFHCTVEKSQPPSRPRFVGGDRAAGIRNDAAQKYILMRRKEGASDGTTIQELALLRRMLHLGVKNGKLYRVASIELPKEPPARKGFLEPADFRRLLNALPNWLRPPTVVAYATGMRRGELCGLKWENLMLRDARPHIRLEADQTKNGRGRVIPLTGEALVLIRMQKELRDSRYPDCPFVFFRPRLPWERKVPGWRAVGDFRKTWDAACESVGVPGLRWHDMRRSACRNLIRAGVPQSVAMSISGHITTSVFIRYDISSEADKFEAMERVGRYVEERAEAGGVVEEPREETHHVIN